METKPLNITRTYETNVTYLKSHKVYSPIYDKTFNLLTDEEIKKQLDTWYEDGKLPKLVKEATRVTRYGTN